MVSLNMQNAGNNYIFLTFHNTPTLPLTSPDNISSYAVSERRRFALGISSYTYHFIKRDDVIKWECAPSMRLWDRFAFNVRRDGCIIWSWTYIEMVRPRPLGALNSSGFSPTMMFLRMASTRSIVSSTIVVICFSACKEGGQRIKSQVR